MLKPFIQLWHMIETQARSWGLQHDTTRYSPSLKEPSLQLRGGGRQADGAGRDEHQLGICGIGVLIFMVFKQI